jgi:pimeloyl-ACP methyl ester carboxylesterase
MAQTSMSSDVNKQPTYSTRRRRLVLVPLVIVALIVLSILVNSAILMNQTKVAHLTTAGAKLIHTSRGTLQVLDQGKRTAPPLVLIHGFASSLHWWDKITPLLTPQYRVIRMDLLGDGGSENPPSGDYTVEDQAMAIGEILHQLGVTHAMIVGHSLGGAVAVSLAEQRPDEVARIVILDTSTHAKNASLGRTVSLASKPLIGPAIKLVLDLASPSSISHADASGFAPGFKIGNGFEKPDQPGLDLQEMSYTSFVENQDSFGSFTNVEPMETRLIAIGKPLLVIFGAEDQIAIGEANDLSGYRTVPGAQVVVLPGVGHSPQVEDPDKTTALILGFLQ